MDDLDPDTAMMVPPRMRRRSRKASLSLRVTHELRRVLDGICDAQGVTLSEWVESACLARLRAEAAVQRGEPQPMPTAA